MFFKEKIFTPFLAVLIAVVFLVAGILITCAITMPGRQARLTPFDAAVADTVLADDEEVCPLIKLDAGSKDVTWNDAGDKVLLLTFHNDPAAFTEGSPASYKGELWTVTEKEFVEWYKENRRAKDWELRLKQLLGLPEETDCPYVSALWVAPEDCLRPAYETDVTKSMTVDFDDDIAANGEYMAWFYETATRSYCENTRPWTRLGYTYDWGSKDGEYGLTEFLVKDGTSCQVEFTKEIPDFIKWARKAK